MTLRSRILDAGIVLAVGVAITAVIVTAILGGWDPKQSRGGA
jgi:hypothetical protein